MLTIATVFCGFLQFLRVFHLEFCLVGSCSMCICALGWRFVISYKYCYYWLGLFADCSAELLHTGRLAIVRCV